MSHKTNKTKKASTVTDSNESEKSMFVAVRIRPLSDKEKEMKQTSCCEVIDGRVVAIKKAGNAAEYLKTQAGCLHEYGFDAAFPEEATQYEVYEKTAKQFLQYAIDGINVTVFAYGATGAGKTHTLMGNARCDDAAAHAEAGIIPNSICDLFDRIEKKRKHAKVGEKWTLIMNYIEVYNEQVYDLLNLTNGRGGNGKSLSVREDKEKGIVICAGVTDMVVNSADEVLELLHIGNKGRATEATMANSTSSRSHAVLQITIKYSSRTERGNEKLIESKLSLIDLAGSERASQTNNRGARLQEGASINRSLLALANCINALAAPGKGNVKYRDSKLTHLLKSSLEGNCKLVMIANVNPSNATFEDSHNTLKYSNRAKNIKLNPVAIEQSKDSSWLERENRLRSENTELRKKVEFLENLVATLRSEILSGQHNADSIASELDMNACLESAPNNEEQIYRAHSPSQVRQVKNSLQNNGRRRSSTHIPTPDEVNCNENRKLVRKNRASMCADVLTTLLTLPSNATACDVNSMKKEVQHSQARMSLSPKRKRTFADRIDEEAAAEEEELKNGLKEAGSASNSPWKNILSDTMLADGLFAATTANMQILGSSSSGNPLSPKKEKSKMKATAKSPNNATTPTKRMKLTFNEQQYTHSPPVVSNTPFQCKTPFDPSMSSMDASQVHQQLTPFKSPMIGACVTNSQTPLAEKQDGFNVGAADPNYGAHRKRRGSLLPRPKVRASVGMSVDDLENNAPAAPVIRRSARLSVKPSRLSVATVHQNRRKSVAQVDVAPTNQGNENVANGQSPGTDSNTNKSIASKMMGLMSRVTGMSQNQSKQVHTEGNAETLDTL